MDPLHPIAPGPPTRASGRPPIERVERVSRERDRPDKEGRRRQRRTSEQPGPLEVRPEEGDDGLPHIDVRV
jgi:hypothetical protein